MEVETSTGSRRSSLIDSSNIEPNLISSRRSSLEVSSSTSRTPRTHPGSSPSPQLCFGSKRRRSKQITPLPLDLGASSMAVETDGTGGDRKRVPDGSASYASKTNSNPDSESNSFGKRTSLHPSPHPTQTGTEEQQQEGEEDEDEAQGQGQAPRKLRKVVSEEQEAKKLDSTFSMQQRSSIKGKQRSVSPGSNVSAPAKVSSEGPDGTSKAQVSHSRSSPDPKADAADTTSHGIDKLSYESGHSRISTSGQDQESNESWQNSGGPMSIAMMSNSRPASNPSPNSPPEHQLSRSGSSSDVETALAPPYFPGSQRAVAASGASPIPSGQPLIHPSLAGLPGSGGGPGSKQQPSFVIKLYSMLEDQAIQDMIKWGSNGHFFSVASPSEFSKRVLPNYFKHSNWQSFVRQLNMYGFHKVQQNQQNTQALGEDGQIWEFKHPSFRRGALHLLADIKRKSSRPGRGGHQSPTQASLADDTESRPDLEQSVGNVSPSPQLSNQAVLPGTLTSNFSFPAKNEGRMAAAPYQRDRPASHSGSLSRFPSAAPSTEVPGGLPIPQPSRMGRARAGTDAQSNPYNPPSPSATFSQSSRNLHHHHHHHHQQQQHHHHHHPHHHQEPFTPAHQKQSSSSSIRVDDLSDRIDAVIRHASYLETQLRNVSEQLYHSQQTENATRSHSLRMLNRLTNVCSSWCSTDTREGAENRRIMLEACHEEIANLHSLLEIEPGTLSPPITPAALPGLRLPHSTSHHSGIPVGVAGSRDNREREREINRVSVSPRMRHEGSFTSSIPSYSYSTSASSSSRYQQPPPPPQRTSSSPSFPFSQPQSRR